MNKCSACKKDARLLLVSDPPQIVYNAHHARIAELEAALGRLLACGVYPNWSDLYEAWSDLYKARTVPKEAEP